MTKAIIYKLLDELPDFYGKDSNTTTYQYMRSLALEFENSETAISNLSDDVFIDTSTGQYLNDLARLFRLNRKSGETDIELRSRIKGYWPGFSGGGTIAAFKAVVNRITGVSEDDVIVTEIDFMKLILSVVLNDSSEYSLIDTIDTLLQQVKAAGVWLDSNYILAGDILTDAISISDSISLIESGSGVFTAGVSLAGGSDLA